MSLPLEHAFGLEGEFKRAGAITMRATVEKGGAGAVRFSHVKVTREPLSDADGAALAALLAADGTYRVRVPADTLSADAAAAAGRWVSTWLPLRCLVAAGLAEHFTLHSDEAGRVYGLEYTPPGGACAPADDPLPPPPARWLPRSSASVKLAKEAPPLPSTQSLRFDADAVDAAAEAAADGAPGADDLVKERPPEKSFLSKYGLFIAVLLFNIMFRGATAGAEEPRQAGGGGGGNGGGGAKRD